VPIAAAVDMHATLTPRLVEGADLLMAYQTFPPHWDKHDIGVRLARLLVATVRHEIEPVSALINMPMLLQPESEDTRKAPMADVMAMGRSAEKQPHVLAVSMVVGFPPADVPLAGTSVLVITDRDPDLARQLAAELGHAWFAMRDAFRFPLVPIDEAVKRARAARSGHRVLLCDQADNPGAGGAGDATALLDALIREEVPDVAYGVIADPDAVAKCIDAGVGATVQLAIGEHLRPLRKPLEVVGAVKTVAAGTYANSGPMWTGVAGDLGRAVLLRIGGLDLIICERANGSWDPAVYTAVGIDLRTKRVIVSKSQIFGLEGLHGLYDEVVVVDGEGWGTTNYHKLPFAHVRHPIFPLNEAVELNAEEVYVRLGASVGRPALASV
jgi:microcystin degradation protein MlrC